MQAVLYRNKTEVVSNPSVGKSEDELGAISPELFYPECGQEEMAIWTHWLPTSHIFFAGATYAIWGILQNLKAPREVLEEFKWASHLQMFDEYAIRTPIRRDGKDPLLLARAGNVWYRLALWGESALLSVQEISLLASKSLVVKSRVAKWEKRIGLGGIGLAFFAWLACLWLETAPSGIGLVLMLLIAFLGWMPTLVYKPENAQHNFLDRYRR